MTKTPVLLLLGATCAVSGCQTPQQTLAAEQGAALQTAVSRGQFEMNCPAATGQILSRNLINPVLNGPMMNGVQRAEYTIGVSGCGQRQIYISVCQIGSVSCISAASRNNS